MMPEPTTAKDLMVMRNVELQSGTVSLSELASHMEPEHLVFLLSQAMNNMTLNAPRFGQRFGMALDQCHRTLQSEVVKMLIAALLAYKPWGTDPRNEHAAELCSKLRLLDESDAIMTDWWMV